MLEIESVRKNEIRSIAAFVREAARFTSHCLLSITSFMSLSEISDQTVATMAFEPASPSTKEPASSPGNGTLGDLMKDQQVSTTKDKNDEPKDDSETRDTPKIISSPADDNIPGEEAKADSGSNTDEADEDKEDTTDPVEGPSEELQRPRRLSSRDRSSSIASLNTLNSTAASTASNKSVRFDKVEIREHGVILGDHPATRIGPPVTIDWDHQAEHSIDVDEYEKGSESGSRRGSAQLRMPLDVRQELLKNADYSLREMIEVQRSVRKTQQSRSRTSSVSSQDFQPFEEAWESAVRKLKRWRGNSNKGKSPDLAELWLQDYKKQQMAQKSGGSMKRCTSTSDLDFANTERIHRMRDSLRLSSSGPSNSQAKGSSEFHMITPRRKLASSAPTSAALRSSLTGSPPHSLTPKSILINKTEEYNMEPPATLPSTVRKVKSSPDILDSFINMEISSDTVAAYDDDEEGISMPNESLDNLKAYNQLMLGDESSSMKPSIGSRRKLLSKKPDDDTSAKEPWMQTNEMGEAPLLF